MRLKKPYTNKDYADLAVYCNENGLVIEDKGDCLESVEPVYPASTIEEKNEQIRQQRQSRFVLESDPLYLDYVEAQARNDDTVDEKKQLWLDKKDEIRNDLPYIE